MDTKRFIEFVRNISGRVVAEADIALAIEDAYMSLDLNPHTARQKSKALQVQRQGRGGTRRGPRSHDFIWHSLGPWAALSQSSIVIFEGTLRCRDWIEEIAIETTQLVEMKSVPVAWSLNIPPESKDGEELRRYTAQDIIAQLCLQFLRQNPRRHRQPMIEKCLSMSKAAATELEWFGVLAYCLEGLDEVYIILNLDVMSRGIPKAISWPALFESMSQSFATNPACCIVKVILFTCAMDLSFGDLSGTTIVKLPKDYTAALRPEWNRIRHQPLNPKPDVAGSANVWLQHVGRPRVKRPRSPDRNERSEVSGNVLDVRTSKR